MCMYEVCGSPHYTTILPQRDTPKVATPKLGIGEFGAISRGPARAQELLCNLALA